MKINPVRLTLLAAILAATPMVFYGQMGAASPNQPSTPNQPLGMQPPNNNASGMAGAMTAGPGTSAGDDQSMRDKMFLRNAAAGGMAEVQLGQLAADKAGSLEVKAFGQKMVTDHTALNNEMKPFADSLGVPLPKKLKKEDQAEYDKLNALSGEEFDKEYLSYMVKDHHTDLREFRNEAAEVQDPTLKAAVEKGFGVIREHSRMVEKLARSKGIEVPQRGGRPTAPPSN